MSSNQAQGVAGPLTGLLVIDLTHVLNGPFGTTILSDLGARVIKIGRPGGGDDTRAYGPFLRDQISGYADPPTRAGAPALDQHGALLRREFGEAASVAAAPSRRAGGPEPTIPPDTHPSRLESS